MKAKSWYSQCCTPWLQCYAVFLAYPPSSSANPGENSRVQVRVKTIKHCAKFSAHHFHWILVCQWERIWLKIGVISSLFMHLSTFLVFEQCVPLVYTIQDGKVPPWYVGSGYAAQTVPMSEMINVCNTVLQTMHIAFDTPLLTAWMPTE